MGVEAGPDRIARARPRRRARRASRIGGVVAVTGIHGTTGRMLVRRLEEDERYTRLILVDSRPPSLPVRRSVFCRLDLTEPLADALLADVLRREAVETVVHLALADRPTPRRGRSHEIDTVGTQVLLNAAADCVSRGTPLGGITALSTAMVYGARPTNHCYLPEDTALGGGSEPGFVRDKVDVENQLAGFRRETGIPVTVLRPCWTLGRQPSIASRMLRRSPAVAVLGFDPLMQLLHPDDLVDALKRAADERRDGAFNVAGHEALPLSALFRATGGAPLRLPGPLAYAAADLLWRSQGLGLGVSLDYVRHLWLVEAERIRIELGFVPRHSTIDVVREFSRAG